MSRLVSTAGIGLLSLLTLAPNALSEDKVDREPVEGAWRLVESKNGNAQVSRKSPEGFEMTNCIIGGRFIWTIVQGGQVIGVGGGRYTFEKDKFTESIECVTGPAVPASFVGSKYDFTVTFDGAILHKVGTIQVNGKDYKVDEKWERCK